MTYHVQPLHLIVSQWQTAPANEEIKLYRQFHDSLESLLELIDNFERLPKKIQAELQDLYPMLQNRDKLEIRAKLQEMIDDLERLAISGMPTERPI
jgi:hypothetical protein